MINLTEENAVYRHGHLFAEQLARGLADNWSQVITTPQQDRGQSVV